jgi:hypothetical protein
MPIHLVLAEAVEGEDIGDIGERLAQVLDQVADEREREPLLGGRGVGDLLGKCLFKGVRLVPGPATISRLSESELTIASLAAVRFSSIS